MPDRLNRHATDEKGETTIAANTLELLAEPLARRWLERARRSHSAAPRVEITGLKSGANESL